jgi:hypothetical protein
MATATTPERPGLTSILLRRRRWIAGAAAALLAYSLFGFFVVPRLVASQIRSQARAALSRDASVRRVRFNPFTLAATIDGLRLADRDGADLLTIERLDVNLQLSGIFRRALRFREVLVERPLVAARILQDGRPSVADLIESTGDAPGPVELPRLIVDRLAIQGGVVRFSDASRQPEYQSRFEPLSLDVTNLVTLPDEEGEHTVAIGVGDGAQLRWTGRQVVEPLHFAGRLQMTGLSLAGLWDYAAQGHALQVRGGRADVTLPYEIRRAGGAGLEVVLAGASLDAHSLTVGPRAEATEWLTIPSLRVDSVDAVWPRGRVDAGRLSIAGPHIVAQRSADGALNWVTALTGTPATAGRDGPGMQVRIGEIDVTGASVAFDDRSVEPGVALQLSDVAARASGVSTDLEAAVPFSVTARVQGSGTIDVSGTLVPAPLSADVQLTAAGIDLPSVGPYISAVRGAQFGSGRVSAQARVAYSGGDALTMTVDGSVDDVELRDTAGERLAAWRGMAVQAFTLDGPPVAARIRRVVFDGAFARLHIDENGNLNLARLLAGDDPAPASAARPSPAARVEIGRVDFRNASADFSDDSLILPFRAQIHSANGSISDISSFASAPASIRIEGRVDRTGVVNVDGTLRLADPMASSEINVGFRSIEMPGLTPYFAEFAGYALRSGMLDLDVKYLVKERRLNGNHSIVARDLVLGDRVRDSKGPGFAVRLAVALLKDREGRINLDVPIEGTVDDPEFGYRKVFWSAVRTILGNAAKAPFRALGRLFGRDEDDLELVEFDAGRSDLLPLEQDKLAKLSEQLAARPELTLAVEGRFDPKADAEVMKRARLEALIESRRTAATAAVTAGGGSTLETILESLFVERFSAEALQAERARFGGAAPAAPPAEAPAAPAAPAPQAPSAFDGAAFYESLRARLIEAQPITPADLATLATARAASIRTALTSAGGLDAARITLAEPATVKRAKAGSSRISSELTMSAGPDDEGGAP